MTLDCRSVYCPAREDVQGALALFTEAVPRFDPGIPIVVEWHGHGEYLPWTSADGKPSTYTGLTLLGGRLVRVSSFGGLAHEFIHVQSWRDGEGGNAEHFAWPQVLEDRVKATYRERGLQP